MAPTCTVMLPTDDQQNADPETEVRQRRPIECCTDSMRCWIMLLNMAVNKLIAGLLSGNFEQYSMEKNGCQCADYDVSDSACRKRVSY